MRQKPGTRRSASEKIMKDIQRATRKQYSAEEKIRIVLDGLRGEDSFAELCRHESISQGVYYKWSKDFMEAGKKHLAGDTARAVQAGDITEYYGEPDRIRTCDPLIKSQLLYQLSYGPGRRGN